MFYPFLLHLPYPSRPLFSSACAGFYFLSSLSKSAFHFRQNFQFRYNTKSPLRRRERFCFNVICVLSALEYHLNYDLLQVLGFTQHFVSIITYHFTFVFFLLCVFNSSCLNGKINIGSKTLTICVMSKSKRGVRRCHTWHRN